MSALALPPSWSCFPLSWRLLQAHPAWWLWILAPLALNLVLGLALLALGWGAIASASLGLAGLAAWLLPAAWAAALVPWLGGLLGLALGLALLLGLGWALARFGVVLGAPFYAQLAEAVAAELAPGLVTDTPFRWGQAWADLRRALGTELVKASLGLAAWGLGLLLGLLPLVGPPLSLAWGFAVAATWVCFDAFDAPLSRRKLSFGDKLRWIWRPEARRAHLGFAALALPLVSLPGLNLLGQPWVMASGAAWAALSLTEEV